MKIFELIMSFVILACIVGCMVLYRKVPKVSGRLGIAVIALGVASFAIEIVVFAITKEGVERVVLLCTALLVSPAVAYYWFRVWQRKRPDTV